MPVSYTLSTPHVPKMIKVAVITSFDLTDTLESCNTKVRYERNSTLILILVSKGLYVTNVEYA